MEKRALCDSASSLQEQTLSGMHLNTGRALCFAFLSGYDLLVFVFRYFLTMKQISGESEQRVNSEILYQVSIVLQTNLLV